MFHNDAVIEAGEIRDGFMIDELGRLIYFPAVGPARWLRSSNDETILRTRIKWCTGAGWVICVGALAGYVYWFRALGYEAFVFVLIMIGARQLGASWFARRFPQPDDREITHLQAWTAWMAKRSHGWLWAAILGNVAGALVLLVPLFWLLWSDAITWGDGTKVGAAVRSHVFFFACPAFAPSYLLGAYRSVLALRQKMCRVSLAQKTKPPAVGDSGR
jgi:hypothetical protein